MAYRRKYRSRRRNPLGGLSGGVVKDAAFVLGGALGSSALPGMVAPSMASGWGGVGMTGVAAVALSMAAKAFAGPAAAGEVLKGGLAVMVLRALHQAGFAKNLGLGMYAPSWFGVPTASSQYLQASGANIGPYRRGGGTIFFPGPGQMSAPAAAAVNGMAYHRFRSRYAGGYG